MYPYLQTATASCPYCGEPIEILIDLSVPEQTYVEDCAVCCRPITLSVAAQANGDASVTPRHEDDCG